MATERAAATLVLRLAGTGLTAAAAAIHLRLWAEGYRDLAVIGPLFLLDGVVGVLLAAALLVTPVRRLGPVAALTALFTAGALGALFLSLTTGLFGFYEAVDAELVLPTLYLETAGTAVLVTLVAFTLRPRGRGERHRHRHPRGRGRTRSHGAARAGS
ncbi:hypothetical protein [Streptomyces sp. NPDC093094]|uniref:hypothetical protein n=1 Tax=Streptomyces sp. NPDC093094 TaxID=3366026 RepID=UPI00381DD7E2